MAKYENKKTTKAEKTKGGDYIKGVRWVCGFRHIIPKFTLALINSSTIKYFFDRYIVNNAGLTVHLDGHYLKKSLFQISQNTPNNLL